MEAEYRGGDVVLHLDGTEAEWMRYLLRQATGTRHLPPRNPAEYRMLAGRVHAPVTVVRAASMTLINEAMREAETTAGSSFALLDAVEGFRQDFQSGQRPTIAEDQE